MFFAEHVGNAFDPVCTESQSVLTFVVMSRLFLAIFACLMPLLLGGCNLRMPVLGMTGDAEFGANGEETYQKHLVVEYRALAGFEKDVLNDEDDAAHFHSKAMKAASGFGVQPDEIDETEIPERSLPALKSARASLVDALVVMRSDENDPFLALAQVKFDCWLALQADYPQYTNRFVCQEQFYEAMQYLTAPPDVGVDGYAVYFESAATELGDDSIAILRQAANDYKRHPGWTVVLKGYTDSKGDKFSNEILARRRCISVKNMLAQQGVDLYQIEVDAVGVARSDGSAEQDQRARRVEIRIVPQYGGASS